MQEEMLYFQERSKAYNEKYESQQGAGTHKRLLLQYLYVLAFDEHEKEKKQKFYEKEIILKL